MVGPPSERNRSGGGLTFSRLRLSARSEMKVQRQNCDELEISKIAQTLDSLWNSDPPGFGVSAQVGCSRSCDKRAGSDYD
jgi:hypothetical protein